MKAAAFISDGGLEVSCGRGLLSYLLEKVTWTRCHGLFDGQWRIGGRLAKLSSKLSTDQPF